MKNLFLILLLIAVIVSLGWYLISNNKKDNLASDVQLPENLTTDLNFPDQSSKTANSEADVKAGFSSEDFKSLALKIIDRPIIITAPLSEIEKKQAENKIKEMNDLIKENYDFVYPWYDLGAYRRIIGDFEGAAEAWNFILLIRPNDFVAYHNLGDLYGFYVKDYPKSEENYLKSIKINPQNIQAYLDLATIYRNFPKGKSDQIENLLLEGLTANPANPALKAALENYRNGKSE